MKWLLRIGAALAVLVVVALGLLAVALPRLARSDAVRSRIEAAARTALGRELRYRDLDFGLLPPSLLVLEPEVAGEGPGDPAFASAERVALRVALLPLLARSVVVDSLVVEGASLHVVRSAAGLRLPHPEREGPSGASGDEPAPREGAPAGSGLSLAVRRVALRDTTVVLEDRAVTPPVTWRIERLDFEASGTSPEAPLELAGSLRLASGGEVRLSGTSTLAGVLDLSVSLREVDLAAATPYLEAAARGARVKGRVGGDVRVEGPAADPTRIAARLEIAEAGVAAGGAELSGPLALEAELAHAATGPAGPFRVDATGARLVYGDGFAKPAGTKATLAGRLVTGSDGAPGVDELVVQLRNLVLRGGVRTAPKPSAVLQADAFTLEGWEEIVPALAATPLGGAVAVPGLQVGAEPLALNGSVELRDVEVRSADRPPVVLRGRIDAEGTTLGASDLQVIAAEQVLHVRAALYDIATQPHLEAQLKGVGLKTEALLAAYAGQPDRLYGPLDVKGILRARAGERPLLDTLAGGLDFYIQKGRIVGVSLLEAAFAKLGGLGGLAIEAGRVFGGRDLQRFYGDEFESLHGRLRVSEGSVHADELAFVYRGYRADLTGTVGLGDLALDLRGTLTLFPEIDAQLAEHVGLGRTYEPRERTLSLAHVGGTLDAPEVQPARNSAVELATAYARAVYKSRLGHEVDKELGPGTGEAVERGLDVLEGILGGKSSR